MQITHTHIFHIVLDPILLEVGRCLSSVEPLSRIHVCFLKVVPVNLQLVFRVGAQVHCSEKKLCHYGKRRGLVKKGKRRQHLIRTVNTHNTALKAEGLNIRVLGNYVPVLMFFIKQFLLENWKENRSVQKVSQGINVR